MPSPFRSRRWSLFQNDFGKLRRQHRLAGNAVFFFFSYGVFQLSFTLVHRLGFIDEVPGLIWLLILSAIYTLSFWPARKRFGD